MELKYFTANCDKCHKLRMIKQIHIAIPIIIVLDCGHKIRLSIPDMSMSQDI